MRIYMEKKKNKKSFANNFTYNKDDEKRNKVSVALRYNPGEEAPKIIASGRGALADKIIEKAKESDVPLYQDSKLANTLSKLEIGDMIPPELYRIWDAEPVDTFNLSSFDKGDYQKAIEEENLAKNIVEVLYPNDNHYAGKELRLKQQYFFVSASVQRAIDKYKEQHDDVRKLYEKAVLQP